VSLCGETTKDHYREEQRDCPGSVCPVGGARCTAHRRCRRADRPRLRGCLSSADRCRADRQDRRRRVDQCLFAVVMEAYLHGTSTRKVDDLVKALGADSGISRCEVSRICKDLDTEVAAFRDRLGGRRLCGFLLVVRLIARHVWIGSCCRTTVSPSDPLTSRGTAAAAPPGPPEGKLHAPAAHNSPTAWRPRPGQPEHTLQRSTTTPGAHTGRAHAKESAPSGARTPCPRMPRRHRHGAVLPLHHAPP
jgi:hypothetical protein